MDKWEDYPIKVLGIAPLIMVTLPSVSSFSSTSGCFLRVERSFSRTISLLFSLACGWPLGRMALCLANGGASSNLGLKDLRVQEKGGRTDPRSGPGRSARADRPRPIPVQFGHPFAPVGPHVFMHIAPYTCTILTMSSSRPRWRLSLHEVWSFTLQSSGMFLCNTTVLATIGSDFIKLINTNKTP
jgi:hypothetical protein